MNVNIRQRLLLTFAAFLLVALSAIGGSLWYIKGLNQLHREKNLLTQIETNLERNNYQVAQFLREGPSAEAFFTQQTTRSLSAQEEIYQDLTTQLTELADPIAQREDRSTVQEINGLLEDLEVRNVLLMTLRDSLYVRGFKDYGWVGIMRDHAHNLEDLLPERYTAQVLFLRRHEKDYIIRHDQRYAEKLFTRAAMLRKILDSQSAFATEVVFDELAAYEDAFRRVVSLDNEIGLFSGLGLLGQLNGVDAKVLARVERIRGDINAYTISTRANLNWIYLFGVSALMLGGVWLAFVLSRRYTRPLVSLSEAIREVVASDFQASPDIVPKVSRPQEIGQLSEDLKYLHQTLQEHIEALQNESRLAAQANRAKSAFLASMSHEIRTPLNGVIGAIQLLRDMDLNDEQAEQLDIMHLSSQNLMALIEDILDFTRIEAGGLSLEVTHFELLEEVNKVIRMLRAKAEAKELAFGLRTQDDSPVWLLGDPLRLRQILINLVNNAIKFTERGGVHVALEINLEGDRHMRVRFVITDTGIGIAPEQQQRLFHPFSQADTSIARRFGGTGLGLTIARELVELMGGTIGLNSELNRGSQFYFEIVFEKGVEPLQIAPSEDWTQEAESTIPGMRILLAEDHKVNQKVIKRLLSKEGHAVEVFNNGQEALEARMEQTWDLVLMDMQMPILDGLSATVSIRAWEKSHDEAAIPIIALTANALPEDRERCMEVGMNGFLAKPLVMKAFRAEVSRILDLIPPRPVDTR